MKKKFLILFIIALCLGQLFAGEIIDFKSVSKEDVTTTYSLYTVLDKAYISVKVKDSSGESEFQLSSEEAYLVSAFYYSYFAKDYMPLTRKNIDTLGEGIGAKRSVSYNNGIEIVKYKCSI